jgi:hypothetical protein
VKTQAIASPPPKSPSGLIPFEKTKSARSFFRARRRPQRTAISVIDQWRARRFVDGRRAARGRAPPLVSSLSHAILDARAIGSKV